MDRAALDEAQFLGMSTGGWCPSGRRSEDGRLSDTYPLIETPSRDYEQRTEWNVRDSDATLVLLSGRPPSGGTTVTLDCAGKLDRPHSIVDLSTDPRPDDVATWIRANRITVLNVAGPRESEQPGIYGLAAAFLGLVFAILVRSSASGHVTDLYSDSDGAGC